MNPFYIVDIFKYKKKIEVTLVKVRFSFVLLEVHTKAIVKALSWYIVPGSYNSIREGIYFESAFYIVDISVNTIHPSLIFVASYLSLSPLSFGITFTPDL